MKNSEINKRPDEADRKLFKAQELILAAKTSIYEVHVAKAEQEIQEKQVG